MTRKPPGRWSARLSQPIVTPDGKRLVTLADAHEFVLAQPESNQKRTAWQTATKLLIAAAERGGDIKAATAQVRIALYLQGRGDYLR